LKRDDLGAVNINTRVDVVIKNKEHVFPQTTKIMPTLITAQEEIKFNAPFSLRVKEDGSSLILFMLSEFPIELLSVSTDVDER
jgi:hypothetical protein